MNQTVRNGGYEYVVEAAPVGPERRLLDRYQFAAQVIRMVRLLPDGALPEFVDHGRFPPQWGATAEEAIDKVVAEVGVWIRGQLARDAEAEAEAASAAPASKEPGTPGATDTTASGASPPAAPRRRSPNGQA